MVGNITALTDERDGNTYTVAKLEDYKCWMVENLRLDDSASLSVYNTNNPSLPLTNIYDSSTTSNHLSSTSSIAYNATTAPEGWCATNSSACDDQSRLRTDNIALFIDNTSTNYNASNNVYSYGNYYNWYSATAGHGKYGSGYGSGYNAPGDICPFGWHLPTGSASGDIYELNTALNDGAIDSVASNRMRSFPNNFVFSGDVSTNASSSYIYNRNSQAYYWTASAVSSTGAFFMQLSEASVVPSTGQSVFKYSGRAIRCVTLPLG
jgi:uncharacterized protein (TIGR02145 family)